MILSKHNIRLKLRMKLCFLSILIGFIAVSCNQNKNTNEKPINAQDIEVDGKILAELTSPPHVPPPIGDRPAKTVVVEMEILEKEGEIVNGTKYIYWTFGGTVPGSFIRVRVGDEVEFHLRNHPDNLLPHNIDLHAVHGPGGGAVSSFVAPGHETVFSFKVLNPGLYVYHCATAPVGMHIGNGMYGLILVEPAGGLPKVDKEFYIMQGEFYTKGSYGERGLQPFDMVEAITENPDYVVFNGHVGAMTGEDALQVNVGDTVRLFVGNAGPSLTSSFHAIGTIFENVHVEGGTLINHNVQTTSIPAGGATMVEFIAMVPGEIILVDHSAFRTFNKGALAMMEINGEPNRNVYTGTIKEGIYLPEGGTIQEMPLPEESDVDAEPLGEITLEQRIEFGKNIYQSTCFACHQSDGKGIAHAFPPVAESDYLNADVNRAIDIVLFGKRGEITVNGEVYNSIMPAQVLTDREVANVLTYVYNSFGNNGSVVTDEMVEKRRNAD